MKFDSKKENMNRFTLLKWKFLKIILFQNGGQNNFLILRNNANLCLLARKRRGQFKKFLRQKKRIR